MRGKGFSYFICYMNLVPAVFKKINESNFLTIIYEDRQLLQGLFFYGYVLNTSAGNSTICYLFDLEINSFDLANPSRDYYQLGNSLIQEDISGSGNLYKLESVFPGILLSKIES